MEFSGTRYVSLRVLMSLYGLSLFRIPHKVFFRDHISHDNRKGAFVIGVVRICLEPRNMLGDTRLQIRKPLKKS